MSTFTYLAQQTFFFFYTEGDLLWILFYDFLFKCRKYRSKQQILLKAKSNESMRNLQVALQLSEPTVLMTWCFVLSNKSFKDFPSCLRGETVRAVQVNSWGDHCALPLTDDFLSLGSPFTSEQPLHDHVSLYPFSSA